MGVGRKWIYMLREKKKYLDKKNNNKINKSNAVFTLTEYEWRSLFIFLFYFNLLFILLSGFIYHLQQPFLLFQTFHFRPIYELSDLDYMYYHIGMSISLGPGLSKCPREIMLAHICVNVTLQTWSYCVIPSYLQGIMCHISCYKPVHTHTYIVDRCPHCLDDTGRRLCVDTALKLKLFLYEEGSPNDL